MITPLLAALLASSPALRPGMAAGMNLLVVTLDTTRADRLGCYGYAGAATPSLDALARESIRFTNAVTVAPLTLPAHASIFTGRYPPGHGVRLNSEYRLGPEQVTLAELLKAEGYETAAFVSAFVLDARYGLHQGFDHYDDRVFAGPGTGFPAGVVERSADHVTEAALAWLDKRGPARPFFTWVHYFDPHAPYRPPPLLAAGFAGRPYDGEIAFVDQQVGRLQDRLAAKGLKGRTVVVVVADHGESLGEHGESTHGVFVYDAVMRVPLLLSVPGSTRGSVEEGLVSVIDLLPTLLTLLAVKPSPPVDGLSLAGPGAPADRSVYMESLTPFLDFGWAPLYALRSRSEKFIHAPRPEFYDLGTDPAERNDLGAAPGARLARELSALREHSKPPVSPPPDPEARERLAALGYAGGAGPDAGAVLRDPKDMIAVSQKLSQANALLEQGRPRHALSLMLEAERESPRDRSVLHSRAKIDLRLGRLSEAERALRAFRDIRPKADASLLLAQILILDGRHAEAAALLDEAEGLEPRHGGVFIARGDLLARQGRPAEARRSYERAREVDPYRAAALARARLDGLGEPSPAPR